MDRAHLLLFFLYLVDFAKALMDGWHGSLAIVNESFLVLVLQPLRGGEYTDVQIGLSFGTLLQGQPCCKVCKLPE